MIIDNNIFIILRKMKKEDYPSGIIITKIKGMIQGSITIMTIINKHNFVINRQIIIKLVLAKSFKTILFHPGISLIFYQTNTILITRINLKIKKKIKLTNKTIHILTMSMMVINKIFITKIIWTFKIISVGVSFLNPISKTTSYLILKINRKNGMAKNYRRRWLLQVQL